MEALQLAMQINEMPVEHQPSHEHHDAVESPATRVQSAAAQESVNGDGVPRTTVMVRVSVNFEDEWTTGNLIEGDDAAEA